MPVGRGSLALPSRKCQRPSTQPLRSAGIAPSPPAASVSVEIGNHGLRLLRWLVMTPIASEAELAETCVAPANYAFTVALEFRNEFIGREKNQMEPEKPTNWLASAVALNWQQLQQRYSEAQKSGAAWLVECRDMYDAVEDDAGIYFEPCSDAAAVDKMVADFDSRFTKILGIYSLRKPLESQGTGLTVSQWKRGIRYA